MNKPQELTFRTSQNIMTIVKVLDTPTMPAHKFQAHCLDMMNQANLKKAELVVTKQGEPVAKLVPVDTAGPEPSGFLVGTVTYYVEA